MTVDEWKERTRLSFKRIAQLEMKAMDDGLIEVEAEELDRLNKETIRMLYYEVSNSEIWDREYLTEI